MEKKVLLTELVDRGSHLRKEITPTAVVTDNGQYPAGMFWDANKTLNEIVDGATDAQNTLKEIEDKLNQEITDARNAEEAITNRIDDVLGIDAEDIDNLKEVIEDLNSDTGVLSIINNKVDKEDFENLKDSISYELDPANGYDYVEIGGIKWATKNIGASSETDRGIYFQWGDIQGYSQSEVGNGANKKYFDWSDYKYWTGSHYPDPEVSKYDITDIHVVLNDEDDAAMHIYGGSWRMPTYLEYSDFTNQTTNEWVSDYNNSGVSGMLFTSKVDPSAKLFFPSTGKASQGVVGSSTDRGYYRSKSPMSMNFDQYSISFGNYGSELGYVIRPVLDENIISTELGTTISDEERLSWNNKTDKVNNATEGNFAALDSNGNLTDSGHKHSDYTSLINEKADISDLGGLAFKDEATGLVYANGYNSSSNVTFGTASVDVLTGIFGSREPSFTEGAFNAGTLPSLGSATTSSFATEGVIAIVDQPNETVTFTSASTANAVTAQGTFNAGTLPSKAADTFDPGAPGLARSQSVISAIFDATAEAQTWTPSAATVTVS